jgi:tRNA-2-methylthio-N6-dimethylallyladenosine synthase
MDLVQYDFSYMFYYSERPGTLAAKKFPDDVPLEIKKRRLSEIIQKQTELSLKRNRLDIGKVHKVLVEGFSKRSEDQLQGRNSANKVVVFPKQNFKKGDYVNVLVDECTGGTLIGRPIV